MEKILVIEDDRAVRKALKHLFESEGYAVELAEDGAAGLSTFHAFAPSIVILDLALPKISGRDLCREIKKQSPSMRIIVLSAASDEVDKVLLLELGADDYVTKPFSPREAPGAGARGSKTFPANRGRGKLQVRRRFCGLREDGADPGRPGHCADSPGIQDHQVFCPE